MTKVFIDCEFNSFGGELLSLALVAENGDELYLVRLDPEEDRHPWVTENVIPVLYDVEKGDPTPEYYKNFAKHILKFLRGLTSKPIIVADWPCDIKYFCEVITTGPGRMIDLRHLEFEIDRNFPSKSEVPHNALWDARANMEGYLNEYYTMGEIDE